MNDLEHDLRDLLETKSREGTVSPTPAPKVLKRARRRQVGTVLTATISVVAVAALGVVAFGALTSRDAGVPAGQPTTTRSLNGITITFPEPWHLIDPDEAGLNGSGSTQDLPRIVLALSPQAPSELLACPGMVPGQPPTFLMTVQEAPLALAGEASASWPVTLQPMDLGASTGGCYPNWEYQRAGWTAAGRTFEARMGLAPDISDEDREALLAAFSSMAFEPSAEGTSSVVLATGTAGGEDWELLATRQVGGLDLTLQGGSVATGTGGFSTTSDALQLTDHVFGEGSTAERVVFGALPTDVVRIDGVDATGTHIGVDLLDVPDEIDARLDAFVVTLPANSVVTFEAYDAEGRLVASGSMAPETGEPTGPPEAILEDGRHFGYIRSVDVAGRTISFDLAYWLSGAEANQAYQEAGGTGPVPNDHFVVNDNPKLRTLPLSPDLRLRLLDWNHCCDTFFDGDLRLFAQAIETQSDVTDGDLIYRGQSQWWVTVEGGVVTQIEEQYSP